MVELHKVWRVAKLKRIADVNDGSFVEQPQGLVLYNDLKNSVDVKVSAVGAEPYLHTLRCSASCCFAESVCIGVEAFYRWTAYMKLFSYLPACRNIAGVCEDDRVLNGCVAHTRDAIVTNSTCSIVTDCCTVVGDGWKSTICPGNTDLIPEVAVKVIIRSIICVYNIDLAIFVDLHLLHTWAVHPRVVAVVVAMVSCHRIIALRQCYSTKQATHGLRHVFTSSLRISERNSLTAKFADGRRFLSLRRPVVTTCRSSCCGRRIGTHHAELRFNLLGVLGERSVDTRSWMVLIVDGGGCAVRYS